MVLTDDVSTIFLFWIIVAQYILKMTNSILTVQTCG